jgi:Zn-dependent protease with chaperone function
MEKVARETFKKTIDLPDGSLQKYIVNNDDFPSPGKSGVVVIPFWVFDRFNGEKLLHILLHEKRHIQERTLYLISCLVLLVFVLGGLILLKISDISVIYVFLPFTFLFHRWLFEITADRYAARYVSKQAYAETLKEYGAALRPALELKYGGTVGKVAGVVAVILQWCLHPPYYVREKLIG